jgi:putative acetyltransferase
MHSEGMQLVGGGQMTNPPAVRIRPFEPGSDAAAFKALNEEWITRYFTLEPMDRENLSDPQGRILDKGGQIFMACFGEQPVGCVALIPMHDGVYELSKMAVAPEMRGLGIGRRLLEHAIAEARQMGAKSLFLGSNSRLESAVHLYESVGFRHVPAEKIPEMPYVRANVFMELLLS